jgi:hypothetical protein
VQQASAHPSRGFFEQTDLGDRPEAARAIVAKRQHPGIDDLQSSSSARPTRHFREKPLWPVLSRKCLCHVLSLSQS